MQPASFIITIVSVLLFIYAVLINLYWFWFSRLSPFVMPQEYRPVNTFSIIIPARNEEANIAACIHSILNGNYPASLFEIIVVDDFSTDNTMQLIRGLQSQFSNIKLLQLGDLLKTPINSYKKKSIELAIDISTKEWVLTTDADCIVTGSWLQYFDACIQKQNPVFIAAPVMFINDNSFLSLFQCLDFISLQGITAASVSAGFHSMCNGANLAYKKTVFFEVDGFKDIDMLASGDDMLLMHKIQQKYPQQIQYLFNSQAIVKTAPMPNWKSFFNQRIRWASKATAYTDKRIFTVLLLVYFVNFLILLLLPLSLIDPVFIFYFILFVVLKACSELPFMYASAGFFNMRKCLRWFIPMQPIHILYTVVSGLFSKFGKYEWKGRNVR